MKKKLIDNKKIAVKILDPVETIMLLSHLWSAPNAHRKQSTAIAFDPLENVDTDVSALYESHACQAVLHAVKARADERHKPCGMRLPAPPHATSTTRFSPHIAHR